MNCADGCKAGRVVEPDGQGQDVGQVGRDGWVGSRGMQKGRVVGKSTRKAKRGSGGGRGVRAGVTRLAAGVETSGDGEYTDMPNVQQPESAMFARTVFSGVWNWCAFAIALTHLHLDVCLSCRWLRWVESNGCVLGELDGEGGAGGRGEGLGDEGEGGEESEEGEDVEVVL